MKRYKVDKYGQIPLLQERKECDGPTTVRPFFVWLGCIVIIVTFIYWILNI